MSIQRLLWGWCSSAPSGFASNTCLVFLHDQHLPADSALFLCRGGNATEALRLPEFPISSWEVHWSCHIRAHWMPSGEKCWNKSIRKIYIYYFIALSLNSSVLFSDNKKRVLWCWGRHVSFLPEEKMKSSCIGSWLRWGNSQHCTNLPLEQKCQEGLWKCTDGSNYIDNLPFPEAGKSILYWQDPDKFLWKSERNQYSLCDRNSCEGFLVFHGFSLSFFFLKTMWLKTLQMRSEKH